MSQAVLNHAAEKSSPRRIPMLPALEVLAELRQPDQLVVTTMASAREWPKVSQHALDFHHIPATMGGTTPLGLGLALAQPQRQVLVLSGDGSLVMNLGCLVTIVASGAKNLSVVVMDNGIYEVTGGQKTASATVGVDFAGLARAAGFPAVAHFDELSAWRAAAADLFAQPGPRFVWMVVEPEFQNYLLDPPCPIGEQIARLQQGLGTA